MPVPVLVPGVCLMSVTNTSYVKSGDEESNNVVGKIKNKTPVTSTP